MSAQFSFSMQEKRDKAGKPYLFASLAPFLDAVLFIRPETTSGRSQFWQAELKPYTGPNQTPNTNEPERTRGKRT